MYTMSRTFEFMNAEMQAKEIRRTRNAVAQNLSQPRPAFPSVEVVYLGKSVPRHIVDAAFDRAVIARHMAGRPPGFDLLAAFEAALPDALEADAARRARMEPMPVYSGRERHAADAAAEAAGALPSELVAPLVVGGPHHG
jgi:hypothetical protein